MNLILKVWRQASSIDEGKIKTYKVDNIPQEASFLEMMDILNDNLVKKGEDPIHFDHDCREGICGVCSLTINGVPHSKESGITTCQLHMRKFKDGDTIWIEPFRAKAFPIVKDLVCDRSSFDRIIQSGGYVDIATGSSPDANSTPIPKTISDNAFDSAACIGCGACVAACKNSSAMLFVGAKINHLTELPQGDPQKHQRVLSMVRKMDSEGFGNCTNQYECEAVCPKEINSEVISKMNRLYAVASVKEMISSDI